MPNGSAPVGPCSARSLEIAVGLPRGSSGGDRRGQRQRRHDGQAGQRHAPARHRRRTRGSITP